MQAVHHARTKIKQGRKAHAFEAADRLHSAAIHLLRRLRMRDYELGIGPAQLSALSVLVFAGPQSLASLAEVEQVEANSYTEERTSKIAVPSSLSQRKKARELCTKDADAAWRLWLPQSDACPKRKSSASETPRNSSMP
jgi:hypothetical protein